LSPHRRLTTQRLSGVSRGQHRSGTRPGQATVCREWAGVAPRLGDSDMLKCSFCGKTQRQVKKLIAGHGVYICDECVDLCNEIIEEELAESATSAWRELPRPKEICE